MSPCKTAFCRRPSAVPGVFRLSTVRLPVAYCKPCANDAWVRGEFEPDRLADLHAAPDLSEAERTRLAEFDQAPAAPESFDAHAAVRRVLAVAEGLSDRLSTEVEREIARLIRAAVVGDC